MLVSAIARARQVHAIRNAYYRLKPRVRGLGLATATTSANIPFLRSSRAVESKLQQPWDEVRID